MNEHRLKPKKNRRPNTPMSTLRAMRRRTEQDLAAVTLQLDTITEAHKTLVKTLTAIKDRYTARGDYEAAHGDADDAIVAFFRANGAEDVISLYSSLPRHCA